MGPPESDLEERLAAIEEQLERLTKAMRLFFERSKAERHELAAEATAKAKQVSRATVEAVLIEEEAVRRHRAKILAAVAAIVFAALLVAAVIAYRYRERAAPAASPTASSQIGPIGSSATAASTETLASNRGDVTIAEADSSLRAQATTDLAGASDVARFELTGVGDAAEARGQLRWSRTHGLVFTASGLPASPSGMTNEVWLITTAGPIAVGLVQADQSGHVTLITNAPAETAPVTDVRVTREPSGGSATPSGTVFLMAR